MLMSLGLFPGKATMQMDQVCTILSPVGLAQFRFRVLLLRFPAVLLCFVSRFCEPRFFVSSDIFRDLISIFFRSRDIFFSFNLFHPILLEGAASRRVVQYLKEKQNCGGAAS